MLNVCIKCIILIRDIIKLNKTYGEYISRKENCKLTSYILQDEDKSNNWDYIKIDPVKTGFKTENVKTE